MLFQKKKKKKTKENTISVCEEIVTPNARSSSLGRQGDFFLFFFKKKLTSELNFIF
jgi:hypothetical protein